MPTIPSCIVYINNNKLPKGGGQLKENNKVLLSIIKSNDEAEQVSGESSVSERSSESLIPATPVILTHT